MKRSRFTDEQIIGILKEPEAGAKTVDVCRKHGIADASFCKYKAKSGTSEVAASSTIENWANSGPMGECSCRDAKASRHGPWCQAQPGRASHHPGSTEASSSGRRHNQPKAHSRDARDDWSTVLRLLNRVRMRLNPPGRFNRYLFSTAVADTVFISKA